MPVPAMLASVRLDLAEALASSTAMGLKPSIKRGMEFFHRSAQDACAGTPQLCRVLRVSRDGEWITYGMVFTMAGEELRPSPCGPFRREEFERLYLGTWAEDDEGEAPAA